MFASTEEALRIIRGGGMLILTDDEQRENEGDFVMAAEHVTPEAINFMITHGRGLLCISAPPEKIEQVGLQMMAERNTAKMGTPFTVSIDAREGTTTGISAHDRYTTIKRFVQANARLADFSIPGHVFPLRAAAGGVLRRAGHTEASCDLARLAGCAPVGVLCEILHKDGSMARMPELQALARRFKLKIYTIAELIRHRRKTECVVREVVKVDFPTRFGKFTLHLFESTVEDQHHLALVMGNVRTRSPVLVRVHSECLTGDALHSLRCDCGMQLDAALQRIAEEGRGVLLYMRQEGRGIGLPAKLRAYHLQDKGADTVEANERLGFPPDLRDYGYGAQILNALGVRAVRLLTNNPRKIIGLDGYGIKIVERVPLRVEATPYNQRYLETKTKKLGHLL
ncbi:MAG: bifunctional 3,4-dihydroxy-2-butanone-4-phosphate synthase/GTP cyclohydrolase II [bacterium]|nr:bifunctional 3,4-dihydroxy-2-butanone-4-phosphate synthase/GTP cyclohydrolase II [bacterium]